MNYVEVSEQQGKTNFVRVQNLRNIEFHWHIYKNTLYSQDAVGTPSIICIAINHSAVIITFQKPKNAFKEGPLTKNVPIDFAQS
jgi:hypothetical protein